VLEEEGSEDMMVVVLLSIARVLLGTNGGSLTCSRTKGKDEAKVFPV